MQKKLAPLFAGLLLLASCLLQAQNQARKPAILQTASPETAGFSADRLKRIDHKIQEWMADGRLNGCVALIAHKGKVVYHQAFGFDDLAKTKPMRTDAIFRIASQTKAITSVAVMMLYEEGRFLLDDPLSKYIPEFANAKVLNTFNESDSSYTTVPAKMQPSIRQLLTHTSGIGYAQIGSKESNAIYAKAGITAGIGVKEGRLLATDMKKLAALPLLHQPGERWTYGLNSDLLGYLVELLSGQSLDEFFRTRIFEPLGMKDTYFFLPPNKFNRLVTLMQETNGKLNPATQEINVSGPILVDYPKSKGTYFSGGAGLSSTVMDYAIFLQMLLNEGEYNGKRLLARNTVRMMTQNQIGNLSLGTGKFGLGFGLITEAGSALMPTPAGVFEWGGAFATSYWADPKEQVVALIYRQLWGTTQWEVPDMFKILVYQALD